MFNVILNEQTDFVRLILENGFNLDDFLTVHTLERLYTECLKKTVSLIYFTKITILLLLFQ